MRLLRGGVLVVLVSMAGCHAPVPPTGTGAKEAAVVYYEAVLREDWPTAYGTLHATAKKRPTLESFARLASQYRRNLGFVPTAVVVRACEEHGNEAIAHVTLTAAGKSYRDAVTLRRESHGWGVVLPPGFGQGRPH